MENNYDVVVIGSGAAGLSAALSAHEMGARTIILERADMIGGTSAISGGVIWAPNNHRMADVGSSDSREEALTYIRTLSLGLMDDTLIETYVDEIPKLLLFLEEKTRLRFRALQIPDYHPEFDCGRHGRSVEAHLYPADEMKDLRPYLRQSYMFPIPVSVGDFEDGVDYLDAELIGGRMQKGFVAAGNALVAGLVSAVLDRGIDILRSTRARELIVKEGNVVGVLADAPDGPAQIAARGGVVLASGGFEWNEKLVNAFMRGPLLAPAGPPANEGDGLLMAMSVGASLGNMSESWWNVAMRVPGEEYDGKPLNRLMAGERCNRGSIIVNTDGRRFVNEAHSYNDIGRAFHTFDPVGFRFRNLPAWVIIHQGFLDNYPFGTTFPGDPVPNWLIQAATLRELAEKIDVDPDGLEAEVARFNENARNGFDPDFHRGRSVYDQYYGDKSYEGPFRTLGPIDKPPFYATQVYPAALGTKGGPRTSIRAEVLDTRDQPITGLFAAGNAMASIMSMAYPGAGGTLGPALVFGNIAGKAAAERVTT